MPVIPVITPSQTPPDHLAIHITSIEAALLRLNIDIPIEDLIMVMREEELRLEAEKTERYISLSKGKPAPNCLPPLSNCEHVQCFQSLAPRQHLAKESKPFPSPQSRLYRPVRQGTLPQPPQAKRGLPAQQHGSKLVPSHRHQSLHAV